MLLDRRSLMLAAVAATGVAALPAASRSAASATAARNEGTNRIAVGDVVVTTINDGFFDLPPGAFPNAKPDEILALTRRAFLPDGKLRLAVNAFVIGQGDQLTLIDSGAAGFGPSVGRVAGNLVAAGFDPAAIKTVLITHLHADHVNGLLTTDGTAAFPNAEIVASKIDFAFWTDGAAESKAPDGMKPFFAAAKAAMAPYAGKVRLIESGMVAPGIEAIPLVGHTPGHTGYRVSSGDQQMLMWADIVHATALQFARPEFAIAFDVDPAQAVATRKRVLDMVATDRILVAGSHLEFPGVGYVERRGDAYAFVPAPWAYEL